MCLFFNRAGCRCPVGKEQYHLPFGWCRSPTAYFSFVGKVGKSTPRGKPLGYPLLSDCGG